MASNFILTLDTTGPAGVGVEVSGNAATTAQLDVTVNVTTTDLVTQGYQVKLWGDVDLAANPSIKATEEESAWITFAPDIPVRLSLGDGVKTINARVRDDVWNESAQAADQITLDLGAPILTVTNPDVAKVSKITAPPPGKHLANFSFSTNRDIVAWEIRVVPDANSPVTAGAVIPGTNGSTNMTGAALAPATPVAVTIDGRDLELASAGDGDKVVKVFGQDDTGRWSA